MDMPISLQQLIALESEVWEALRTGDRLKDGALLGDDFLGVYPTGFADRDDHTGQLDSGPTVGSYRLEDCRQVTISAGAEMLAYRATYRRSNPGSQHEVMYVTSLWCLRGGQWVNVFSQDTPAGDVDPP